MMFLNKTEPYIKYVDEVRRDYVVVGQFMNAIRKVISKLPYLYTLDDIRIYHEGIEIQIDELPPGNIPKMGSYTFV